MAQDLSHIISAKDLRNEIRLLKLRISADELELKDRWRKLPPELFKATIGAIIPFLISRKITGSAWGIVSSLFNLIKGKKDVKTEMKEGLFKETKRLGVYAAIKGIYSLFRK